VNTEGFVTECAAANLFWIRNGHVETPPLSGELLGGVTRAVILEICAALKFPVRDARATIAELRNAEGVFATVTTFGIVEATALDGHRLARSPLVRNLREGYVKLVERECGGA
jgi:branched-subunit amino acid aminotransferase/4-amino-4-deoxychorismate lyase